MTIFNYDKKKHYWGVVVIIIAVFTAFSNNKTLNKVSPFLFLGVLIQTSAKSKKVEDIKKMTESNLITNNNIASRLDSNDREIGNGVV